MKFQEFVSKKNENFDDPKNRTMNHFQLTALNQQFDKFTHSLATMSDQATRGRLWRALQPFIAEFNNVLENM